MKFTARSATISMVALVLGVSVGTVVAQVGFKPTGSQPEMRGRTDGIKFVNGNSIFYYIVGQTDLDTYKETSNGKPELIPDMRAKCIPVSRPSMKEGYLLRRSFEGTTGTTWYDVTGRSVDENGNYLDSYRLFNDYPQGHPLRDPDIVLYQYVEVTNNTDKASSSSRLRPTPDQRQAFADLLAIARRAPSSREKMSMELSKHLLNAATPNQRKRFAIEGELVVSMNRLTSRTKSVASNYIKSSLLEIGTERARLADPDIRRIDEFELRVSRAFSAIAVYGYDKSGGRIGW